MRYKRSKNKSSIPLQLLNFINPLLIIILVCIAYITYISSSSSKDPKKAPTQATRNTAKSIHNNAPTAPAPIIPLKTAHHNISNGPKIEINFTQSKKLAQQIYGDHRVTFYCGCQYDKHGKINLDSCGYQHKDNYRRAKRLEWEHIMPAHHFGQHRLCWREPICRKQNGKTYKGRNCCRKVDPTFVKMEGDLHNLVPEIGELNGLRSNYRFGMLPYIKLGQFGTCEFKIDEKSRRVEPRADARGMIARIYLYMSNTYQIPLSSSQQQLYEAWNKQYPPSAWEKERNEKIYQVQGNRNSFVN